MTKPKYNIGDKVFHVLPESDCGIVIDIKYSYLTRTHEYQVVFSVNSDSLWYYEHELSISKMF